MPEPPDKSTGNTSLFSIPGNIKQRFLPFCLDPNSDINKTDQSATWKPQIFSYKSKDIGNNSGKIGFYPDALSQTIQDKINDDISFKLLYGSDFTKGKGNPPLTLDTLVNTIPGVSIREYLPDTRLDQCLNFFKTLFGKLANIPLKAKEVGEATNKDGIAKIFEKLWACTTFTMHYMVGSNDKASFLTDAFGKEHGSLRSLYTTDPQNDTLLKYVNDFPYILYYNLQSCTTTNIYQVPAMCEGKPIMSSDGTAGWGTGSGLMSKGGFRASGLLKKIPMIGEIADTLMSNIGINYMPWWDAESGTSTASPEINIKFDLFNDTCEKAVNNFIFINTIVPSNRWVQYNMFQHSSDIYDVKIDGINRLFACSGKFDVTYEGVLRNPPPKFYEKLIPAHLSRNIDGNKFKKAVIENNLIKIPDIYRVNMTFKSLLPANFNNYLYTYTQNTNHMTTYKKSQQEGMGENIAKGIASYVERVMKVWDTGEEKKGFELSVNVQSK